MTSVSAFSPPSWNDPNAAFLPNPTDSDDHDHDPHSPHPPNLNNAITFPPPPSDPSLPYPRSPSALLHMSFNQDQACFAVGTDLRHFLSASSYPLSHAAVDGYAIFFDDIMPKKEYGKWFREVLPPLANLILRLPSLLQVHYQDADNTALRLLHSQQPGLVLLSQMTDIARHLSIHQTAASGLTDGIRFR